MKNHQMVEFIEIEQEIDKQMQSQIIKMEKIRNMLRNQSNKKLKKKNKKNQQ